MHDSTTRFSDRVENYVRYRPSYPAEVLDLLARECGWHAGSIVADIGSGTGISSRLFVEAGNPVYGIEPNLEMRQAAEQAFANQPNFTSHPQLNRILDSGGKALRGSRSAAADLRQPICGSRRKTWKSS